MLNKRNYNKSLNNYDKQLMKQNNLSSSLDDNKLILHDIAKWLYITKSNGIVI